jgi:hypothetical protein
VAPAACRVMMCLAAAKMIFASWPMHHESCALILKQFCFEAVLFSSSDDVLGLLSRARATGTLLTAAMTLL